MLRGIKASFEKHHNLRILDEAVTATVKLKIAISPAANCPTRQ